MCRAHVEVKSYTLYPDFAVRRRVFQSGNCTACKKNRFRIYLNTKLATNQSVNTKYSSPSHQVLIRHIPLANQPSMGKSYIH